MSESGALLGEGGFSRLRTLFGRSPTRNPMEMPGIGPSNPYQGAGADAPGATHPGAGEQSRTHADAPGMVRDGVYFAFDQQHLRAARSRHKVLVLGGALACVSYRDEGGVLKDYVHQPDLLLASGMRLRAWVHPEASKSAALRKTVLFGDALAQWALAQKHDTVIMGVMVDHGQTVIMIAVAENKRLRSLDEWIYQGDYRKVGTRVCVDMSDLMERTAAKNAGKVLECCGMVQGVAAAWRDVGIRPFVARRQRPLGVRTGTIDLAHLTASIVPLAIAAATIAGLGYLAYPHYLAFQRAQTLFNQEVAVISGGGEYAPAEVELLNKRRAFLQDQSKFQPKLTDVAKYATVISQALPAGARVLDMKVNVTPGANARALDAPDITATLMLVLDPSQQALDQVQPILDRIANAKNWRARVVPSGWKEEKTSEAGKERAWRIFTVEAFLPVHKAEGGAQ